MQIIKEKTLATRGNIVIKARVVSFVTRETGYTRRSELVLEKMSTPGLEHEQHVGWSLDDIKCLYDMLYKFSSENQ